MGRVSVKRYNSLVNYANQRDRMVDHCRRDYAYLESSVRKLIEEITENKIELKSAHEVINAISLDWSPPPISHAAIIFNGTVWSLPVPMGHKDVLEVMNRCLSLQVSLKQVHIGFLDSGGVFLDPEQALDQAIENGQTRGVGKKKLKVKDLKSGR